MGSGGGSAWCFHCGPRRRRAYTRCTYTHNPTPTANFLPSKQTNTRCRLAHCSAGFSKWEGADSFSNNAQLGWLQSARPECAAAGGDVASTRGCWCAKEDWLNPLADSATTLPTGNMTYRLYGAIPPEWVPGEPYVSDWIPKYWYMTQHRSYADRVSYTITGDVWRIAPKKEFCSPYAVRGAWNETGVPDDSCAPSARFDPDARDIVNGNNTIGGAATEYEPAGWPKAVFANSSFVDSPDVWVDLYYSDYSYDYYYTYSDGLTPTTFAMSKSSPWNFSGGDVMLGSYFDDYGYENCARAHSKDLRGEVQTGGTGDEEAIHADRVGRGEKRTATAGNWASTLVSM